MIEKYGKVYNLGKPEVRDIFSSPVVVQEKVDGSQFSFGKLGGRLYARSRNRMLPVVGADESLGQFEMAVQTVRDLEDKLPEGTIFRGEAITKPRHNVLCYSRIPEGGVILFDAHRRDGTGFRVPQGLRRLADELGLEVVPEFECEVTNEESFDALMETVSCLGGQKIEGVVFKNYLMPDPQGYGCLKAKYVSPQFREVAKQGGKSRKPGQDTTSLLIAKYAPEARFHKAVQHLRDEGKLQGGPEDIGALIKELQADVEEECGEEITAALARDGWKALRKRLGAKMALWWKDQLVKEQFRG